MTCIRAAARCESVVPARIPHVQPAIPIVPRPVRAQRDVVRADLTIVRTDLIIVRAI